MPSKGDTAAIVTQPFVGRAVERAELAALVERERVVAVVGPAGVGKTALVRAVFPGAPLHSWTAEIDIDDAPLMIWDDVPEAAAEAIVARARAAAGRVVLVARQPLAGVPALTLGP